MTEERGIDRARLELAESKALDKADDMLKHMQNVLDMGTKLKAAMVKRGLVRAKAKCKLCDGYLQGMLAGPKKHLHMHCDGTCNSFMME